MTTLEDISTMAQASGDAIFGHFQVEEITTVAGARRGLKNVYFSGNAVDTRKPALKVLEIGHFIPKMASRKAFCTYLLLVCVCVSNMKRSHESREQNLMLGAGATRHTVQ